MNTTSRQQKGFTGRRLRPLGPRGTGFTLIEITIVLAIIGLIAAIAIPSFMTYHSKATTRLCIQNLTQIEAAKDLWAMQNRKTTGDLPADSDLFGDDLYIRTKPSCPTGGTYTLNPVGQSATCTIAGHVIGDSN